MTSNPVPQLAFSLRKLFADGRSYGSAIIPTGQRGFDPRGSALAKTDSELGVRPKLSEREDARRIELPTCKRQPSGKRSVRSACR
jgi:hypothetical protein